MWNPLFLFIYDGSSMDTTLRCYHQLCEIEGTENVQPVSKYSRFIANTFCLSDYPDLFLHMDQLDHMMYDSFIYKYVLYNKNSILSKSAVITLEDDVWWNYHSKKWLYYLIQQYDVLGVKKITYDDDRDWQFFNKKIVDKIGVGRHELMCLKPLAVTCSKPEFLVKISEYVRDHELYHLLINCELRFGMAAKMVDARIGELPIEQTVKFYDWDLKSVSREREGIYHPVKNMNQIS